MRPDAHKQKASRLYKAKHKDLFPTQNKLKATAAPANELTQPEQSEKLEQPASADSSNDSTEPKPAPAPFSRRKLQDNSYRYEEFQDEEALINARIEESRDQEDMQEFIKHFKTKVVTNSDENVNLVDPSELAPAEREERERMLREMRRQILYDEFTPGPDSAQVGVSAAISPMPFSHAKAVSDDDDDELDAILG
ncbi:hypothetical protein BX661DRAFT_171430 [Kickxella alabastrina]|uniref:uncharacterized protein n=1 Tax=Kickxella alabastrina TaxID=61397 RepID=UPI00221EB950|nr:uncharacterized protein BX661DRAFT_171430 [Kickxella alabastrina]KAI7826753.1 hypothetical protein BX661DRAFT_171430 [Kickxella alabastrina]KAJ1937508.1 hypothetical protein GGF37_005178 [Kickxella alabastrina]